MDLCKEKYDFTCPTQAPRIVLLILPSWESTQASFPFLGDHNLLFLWKLQPPPTPFPQIPSCLLEPSITTSHFWSQGREEKAATPPPRGFIPSPYHRYSTCSSLRQSSSGSICEAVSAVMHRGQLCFLSFCSKNPILEGK